MPVNETALAESELHDADVFQPVWPVAAASQKSEPLFPPTSRVAVFRKPEGTKIAGLEAPVNTTNVNGLPCHWQEERPLAPRLSRGRSVQLAVKRAFDILIASVALLALAPMFLIAGLVIKFTDGGPVFFRQQRVGRDGKPFEIFKFRSMYADRGDDSGMAQTIEGDARIMPVGRFIRRTSIDELPQLLNILKGDMALVGPRPQVAGQCVSGRAYEQVVPYYDFRHTMLPGLTGWAQANGLRGPTIDVRRATDRINHDAAYIQNFSLLLDLRIIARTLKREFVTGSGF